MVYKSSTNSGGGGGGTVNSVGITGNDGIDVSGSPITSSGVITLDLGNITPTSLTTNNVTITGGTITGMPNPTGGSDVANKTYVDSVTAGLSPKNSVRVATTGALTVTYSNGASGVGATLTNAGAQAAIAIDGVTLALNDRVLVKNQAAPAQNGIYTATTLGTVSTNWVLTRATDYDTPSEISAGSYTIATEGSTQAGTLWIETGTGPFTIGTTAIVFTQLMVASQNITLTSDVTGSGAGSIATTVSAIQGTAVSGTTGTTNVMFSASPTTTGTMTAAAITMSGILTNSLNGASSSSPFSLTGTPFAGTGTTSTPLQYFNNAVTQPTTWTTSGTYLGVNGASGFAGNFIDFRVNGGTSLFRVGPNGQAVSANTITAVNFSATQQYLTSWVGAASNAVIALTGAPFSGGTGTTTFPQYLADTSAATDVTTWSTSGTYNGQNGNSGFAGNFLDFHVNGGASVFRVTSAGGLDIASAFTGTTISLTSNATVGGVLTASRAGAASVSPIVVTGTLFTGGTGTTNFPHMLFDTSAATDPTTWSTSGTYIGINADSGFSGNFLDFHVNGAASVFNVSNAGAIICSSSITSGATIQAASASQLRIGATTIFTAPAAATWQLGAAAAAAPVAQTIQAQSVVTGTADTAGQNWTFKASGGTGTGAGGSLIFQVAPAGSTGSTPNSFSTALTIASTLAATFAGTVTATSFTGSVAASNLTSGTLGAGVGFSATSYSAGTKSSGTYTPAASDGNFQYATNGGAHTLAPPSTVCTIIVEYLNNGSAGTITTSGFTKVTGDALTTTNGSKFQCFITKTQNYSSLNVVALQ